MWEDENSKSKRIKIALVVIIIILLLILVVGLMLVRKSNSSQKETLIESSQQSQVQNEENKAELINKIEEDYAVDMETVNTYIPGIVCWGDKLTGGSEGGVSFASALQDLIDENICDLYDFRGTLDYADNVSRVTWSDYTVKIPVVNMGTGEETTNTILGRNGAVPYVVRDEFTVPADAEAVQIKILSENGQSVAPLTQGDGGVNKVTIAGIEGTLSLVEGSYSSGYNNYTFTRSQPGDEIVVASGTEIDTAASSMYTDYIPVVFIGAYGGYYDADTLIEQQKAIIEHQAGQNNRYIVLGIYGFKDGYNNYEYVFSQYETAMQKAFGEHFINLRKYLISDAATDLEITLTKEDQQQIVNGQVPNSLRSSSGSLELSAAAYKQIGQLIYDRMYQLGYFDEVNEELGINDVVAQIKQAELEAKLNNNKK